MNKLKFGTYCLYSTSEIFGCTIEDLLSDSRENRLVEAKAALAHILFEKLKYGVASIGKLINRESSNITYLKNKAHPTFLISAHDKVLYAERYERLYEKLVTVHTLGSTAISDIEILEKAKAMIVQLNTIVAKYEELEKVKEIEEQLELQT